MGMTIAEVEKLNAEIRRGLRVARVREEREARLRRIEEVYPEAAAEVEHNQRRFEELKQEVLRDPERAARVEALRKTHEVEQ